MESSDESHSSSSETDIGAAGETYVERICSLAFFEDFVFRGPKFNRGKQEKELCDVLVLLDDVAVIVEVKTSRRDVKQSWSLSDHIEWANKKQDEARNQIHGALRTIAKGLISKVSNELQGDIEIGTGRIRRFYGIAAIDRPEAASFGRSEPVEYGSHSCEIMSLSFHELHTALRELSTLPDLISYLEFRKQFFRNNAFHGCTELDLLAAFQSRYLDIQRAIDSGGQVHIDHDLWAWYSGLSRRKLRDQLRRPSMLVDELIVSLRKSRGYVPEHWKELSSFPATAPGDYIHAATRLNKLHRVHRREIGQRLLDKSSLCDSTGRPRHFAIIPEHSGLYLFVVSNDDRLSRNKYLANLLDLAMIKYAAREAIGIAINSRSSKDFSIDAIVATRSLEADPRSGSPEDLELASKLFKPGKDATTAEYTGWKTLDPKARFKTRKKRRR